MSTIKHLSYDEEFLNNKKPKENSGLSIFHRILFGILYNITEINKYFGLSTILFIKKISNSFFIFYKKYLHKFLMILYKYLISCKDNIGNFFFSIRNSFKTFINIPIIIMKEFRYHNKENEQRTFKDKLKLNFKFIKYGASQNKIVFSWFLSILMPILSIFILVTVFTRVFDFNYAIEIKLNGNTLGYIENETVYDNAYNKLQQRVVTLKNETFEQNAPQFMIAKVEDKKLLTDAELTDELIKNSNEEIINGQGLYVGNTFIGAVNSIGVIEKTLNDLLATYQNQENVVKAEFTKDIKIEDGLYLATNVVDEKNMINTINGDEESQLKYQIQSTDTLISIAKDNNIDVKTLKQLNPNIETEFKTGEQVVIKNSEPICSVAVTKQETEIVSQPFEVNETKSASYTEGYKYVRRSGVEGKKEVLMEVQYINGEEQDKTEISSKVIEEPVDQEVIIGTRSKTVYNYSAESISGSVGTYDGDKLMWPVSGGYVSSGYGYRGRAFHNALDIAKMGGAYGVPIYSAQNGTVVYTGYNGTYGLLIKVDHGNGLQTWYAHCSKIVASVGQQVKKGQQIANVGTTGFVTGPHVHLEVRQNGIAKNPYAYLQ